jgi:hypothetical protein
MFNWRHEIFLRLGAAFAKHDIARGIAGWSLTCGM